jgi:hypothetical protein
MSNNKDVGPLNRWSRIEFLIHINKNKLKIEICTNKKIMANPL